MGGALAGYSLQTPGPTDLCSKVTCLVLLQNLGDGSGKFDCLKSIFTSEWDEKAE